MAVYVDKSKHYFRGMLMSHMIADTEEELHQMAEQIGLKRKWFQDKGVPHYDICQSKKKLAIQKGAIEVDRRQLVRIIRRLKGV